MSRNNLLTHKNSDSLYAHFSAVNEFDYDVFPNLRHATPIHIKLTEGQALYIPKKWWHWVKTTKKTFAINYWFQNIVDHSPFVFDFSNDLDISILNGEVVRVWMSSGDRQLQTNTYEDVFENFYNSGIDDRYVLTLSNYSNGEKNSHLKDKVANFIKFPLDSKIEVADHFDFNLWVSSNKHDTGLHYDDEDGVLTVLEGEKDIILFSPSDSEFLYPFNVNYDWREGQASSFHYNTYKKISDIDGVSSAELLYSTCCNDVRVLSNISKLFFKYPHSSLVWGYKKDGNVYRWELYYYTLHQNVRIISWDINSNQYFLGEEEHYYYKCDDDKPQLPFWGFGKYKKDGVLYDESKIFVVDKYQSFSDNYDQYMERLGYSDISEQFKDIILNKYDCYEVCIHNKKPNQIFVQYLGISNEDFVEFLTTQQYPSNVIQFVKQNIELNNYHINNEITIVYDIHSKQIVRSGFYGNI